MTWVIKETYSDSKKKISIYCCNIHCTKWSTSQSEAFKFKGKDSAYKALNRLKSLGSNAKLVRLKPKQELVHPENGTVFLDLTMPNPEPNIVVCVYEERAEEFGEGWEYEGDNVYYVCTVNSMSNKSEDVFCELSEYHQLLREGKIKVIWEPK